MKASGLNEVDKSPTRKTIHAFTFSILSLGILACIAPIIFFLYQYHLFQKTSKVSENLVFLTQASSIYSGITLPLILFLLVISVLIGARAYINRTKEESLNQRQIETTKVDLISIQNELMLAEMKKGELSKVFFDLLNYKLALSETLSFVFNEEEYKGKSVLEIHKANFLDYIAIYRGNKESVETKISRYENGFVSKKTLSAIIDKIVKPLGELELHTKNIRAYVKYILMIYKTIKLSTISLVISDYIALFFSQISETELFVIAYYGIDLFNEYGIDPYAFFIEADLGVQLVSELIGYGHDLSKALAWKDTLSEIQSSINISTSIGDN